MSSAKPVLCYGDSNTYGFDPRSFFGDRYPKEVRWTGRLAAAGYDVRNEGMNGRCIPASFAEIRRFEKSCGLLPQEGFLFLMLGSNDLLTLRNPSAKAVAERMNTFLNAEEVKRQMQRLGSHFVLVSPPKMGEGSWVEDPRWILESASLRDGYRELAEKHGISFLDAGELPLCADGVHLTEEGHALLAERVMQKLNG